MKNVMKLAVPAVRIKLTGSCNRSCIFCHEEGDMKKITNVSVDEYFFNCARQIAEKINVRRVMLTGGEPMLHPDLDKIILGLSEFFNEISLTTNGIRKISLERWLQLKKNGLTKAIVTISDVTPEGLLNLELKKRSLSWARDALKNQFNNLKNIIAAGISARVNIVVYDDFEKTYNSVKEILKFQLNYQPEIRLLNNLSDKDRSQSVIKEVIYKLGGEMIGSIQKAGSSNVTKQYTLREEKIVSTKMTYPFHLKEMCDCCSKKQECHEGFYGVRIERIKEEYYVRLCIYKQTRDILIPWEEFINSKISETIKDCSIF